MIGAPSTLIELLRLREEQKAEQLAFRFLVDGEPDGRHDDLSYAKLARRSREIAALLQAESAPGERALLLYPPGMDFVPAFFGCLHADVIAVPAYPPDPTRMDRTLPRLLAIIRDSGARTVLTTGSLTALAGALFSQAPELAALRWLATDVAMADRGRPWRAPAVRGETPAFLQYTSGSTGAPRGVIVSHRNLLHNLESIRRGFEAKEGSKAAFWLPFYHDMGLVGAICGTVYCEMSSTLLSPLAFLQSPYRWLAAISRTRAAISAAPNFGYDLCARKVTAEQKRTLDLSCWEFAGNGGEPVRHETQERFAEAFGPCGFRREAFAPMYGLAESTLYVTGAVRGAVPVVTTVGPDALANGLAAPAIAGAEEARTLVACGAPRFGHDVRVADPRTLASAGPDRVGEIWVRGPSVARGYWNRRDETAATFEATLADTGEGPFLRTGDLGFLRDGQIYVVGRRKDLIIVRGRNHHPSDLELSAEQHHAAIRPGCVAAFSVDRHGEEVLAIVAEVKAGAAEPGAILDAIHRGVVGDHGVEPAVIALVAPGVVPKTSSGKLQRFACRDALLARTLPVLQLRALDDKPGNSLALSLLLFSSDELALEGDKYELLLGAAREADRLGFEAIWLPERHFHPFGGLYPNPATLGAALATITRRVRIRAGSVVLPLHHPLRVAEEWSVVDNLSGGRVDVSVAIGWNPNDFVIAPEHFTRRKELTFAGIETLRTLWRGEAITLPNGVGAATPVRIHPRPRQPELPLWLTCSGGAERFVDAGERGMNVLTALLFQSVQELAAKIARYREARARSGHDAGRVTLMLHTFIGDDLAAVRDKVRRPLRQYLESSVDLWRPHEQALAELGPEARSAVLDVAFERYLQHSALIGTATSNRALLDRLRAAGVDEIACLIDFGVDTSAVLASLPALARLGSAASVAAPEPRAAHPPLSSRSERLASALRAEAAEVLGCAEAELERGLGGFDSLKAVEFSQRVSRLVGVALPATLLFTHPTLASLTARVLEILDEHRRAAGRAPLSSNQRRLIFLEQLEPGTWSYHLHFALALGPGLDVDALRGALDELIRRHDILRTTFSEDDGTWFQIVAAAGPSHVLELVDLRDLPVGDGLHALASHTDRQTRTPFDLGRGPLLRASLVRLPDNDRLLITTHHLLLDGWSQAILVEELAALYRAARDGVPSPLSPPALQYPEACRRQLLEASDDEAQHQLAYWKRQLTGLAPLVLPADHAVPAVRSPRGDIVSFRLSRELTAALRGLAQAQSVTQFMVLLAGFAALLSRCCGCDDLGIGTVVANRSGRDVRGLVGFVANTVVLRCDLAGDPTVAQLLVRARAVVLGSLEHPQLPLDEVVRAVGGARGRSLNPLIQAQLVLEKLPTIDAAVVPWSLQLETPNAAVPGMARFDLGLAFAEVDGALWGTFSYSTDLFERETIERMVGQLETLLVAMAHDPGAKLSRLPLLPPAERARILAWNPAPGTDAPEDSFPHLFEAQVERSPDAAAVRFAGHELSYRALDERANQLARHLRALGVGREQRVAVLVERSTDLVVSFLAIQKAGGVYVPLDPSYPADRLAFLLADSGATVLLAHARLTSRLPAHELRTICLDTEHAALARIATSRPPRDVGPGSLAYVIYTSGSTGTPKGAMLEQRGMVNHLFAKLRELGLGADDTVAQTASQCFDVSVWQMLAALVVGARVDVMPDEEAHHPTRLLEAVAARGITVLELVPSMMREVVAAAAARRHPLPVLRWLLPTGEALAADLCRDWLQVYPHVPLINAYGPTECSDDVTHHVMREAPAGDWAPIGRPLQNLRAYVLDRHLELVPIGVPGELTIGGVGVGRGYAGRPALTAERFIPDPFARGQRLYRTGDRARWRADGVLEFLGRVDLQVKVRGFRIELGEIEAALARHPAVRACVVIAREDVAGDVRLVAYVVLEDKAAPLAALRTALAERLPDYMVPSAFVALEALPLGTSGKVDRRALPAPELSARGEPAPARTPLERFLVELFQELIRVDAVGVEDDFFGLGGTSLLAATLARKLEERLGELVHLNAVFSAPSAELLARYLTRRYPEAVARCWSAQPVATAGREAPGRMTPERVEALRQVIASEPRERRAHPGEAKNPSAVFVLSPPRSGSTLLRVMLAGHPRLFAPPELELLGFSSLRERRRALSGSNAFELEGTIRALMAARGVGVDEARAEMERHEAEDLSTRELYRVLQDAIGGRILVDKTPSYSLELEALERAEASFDEPLYVHLMRHPCGMIHSFEEARLEEVFFRYPHALSSRELAEAAWVISHQNIVRFLDGIPRARQRVVRFEDLVADPVAVMSELCDLLGIAYHPDMVTPYQAQDRKMTDGLHPASRMLGDVKFHGHTDIDPRVATRWTDHLAEDVLGPEARTLATSLGYATAERAPDWAAELRLDDRIAPSAARTAAGPIREVLVTGATGFVGGHLVRELLETTRAQVHCLVRRRGDSDGLARVQDNLARYGLWKDAYRARLSIIAGDLGAARLGLSEPEFERLGAQLDAIYHAGAKLSVVAPYDRLRSANVGGTIELLRLATTGRAKAVHHLSTMSVLDRRLVGASEDEAAGDPSQLPGGYAQSKAVAERLVEQAGARGVPVTVYRLGTISGDSTTGAWNTSAFACQLLAAIIELGMFPTELAELPVAWMPVDFAVRAILRLSLRAPTTERFHLTNPASVPLGSVIGWVRDLGYPVEHRPYRVWRTALAESAARGASPALQALAQFFPSDPEALDRGARAVVRSTLVALDGMQCPPVDARLVRQYLAYLAPKAAG